MDLDQHYNTYLFNILFLNLANCEMHTNILQLDVARKWVCFDYALTTHGQSFSKLIGPFTIHSRLKLEKNSAMNNYSKKKKKSRGGKFIRVSPTGVLQSDVDAKLKIDEF